MHCGMRQVGERHVPYQVDLMVWSNRLDLLALSNNKGEVQIHRLHWQKVWSLPPPKENGCVQAMAWRPDGKALAIGYNLGIIYTVSVEDKGIIDKYELELEVTDELDTAKYSGISCIVWAIRTDILQSATEYNLYDDASIFLQKVPMSSGYKNSHEDNKDCKYIQNPTQLNMLIVGYGTGNIYLNMYGRYPYGTIQLAEVAKDDFGEYKVLDVNMSDDFSVMQVLYVDRLTNNVFLAIVNTGVLSAYADEINTVAHKHGQIVQLMTQLDQTMISITEAWEHILLEMDTKMAYYASSVHEGGVSADLLELLMLGTPSVDLQVYLLEKLTTNDLKKFGNSVELSYSTIQKLVLKQLNIVGQSLVYYLAELRGLTRIEDRYKILGLEESSVTEAIKACCAFLNKCLELQQVIDVSMRNYKAFFRWLFVVIVRQLDEQTPSEIVKINQQELSHIAEFLYNFDNVKVDSSDKPPDKLIKFNLERLGQYLQNQELTILPEDEDNTWHKFLQDNACFLKDNDTFFSMKDFKKYSLVQQQAHLIEAVTKVFDVVHKDTGKYFSVLCNIRCHEDQLNKNLHNSLRVSQVFDDTNKRLMSAFLDISNGKEGIYFLAVNIKERSCNIAVMKCYFSSYLVQNGTDDQQNEPTNLLDLQFYSPEYLSVITTHPENEENTIFIQVPVKHLLENSTELNINTKSCIFTDRSVKKDIAPLLEQNVYKVLEKMDGSRLAVSGGRKVAVILSKSSRKVRVFEMEVDGDDDEDDTLDTTPQSIGKFQNTPDKSNTTNEDNIF